MTGNHEPSRRGFTDRCYTSRLLLFGCGDLTHARLANVRDSPRLCFQALQINDVIDMRVSEQNQLGCELLLFGEAQHGRNVYLFSADDGATGRELWRTDGTEADTMRVKDICPGNCAGLPVVVPLPASVDLLLRSTRTPKPD